MRHRTLLAGCGLLLAGIAAAQPGRYSNPNGYRYDVVERVKRDVQSMAREANRYVDSEKRELFRDTIHHLDRFQYNARRGRFDTDRLDGAIDEMKRLVRSDQVHPRMKASLSRDIETLRDFRASGGYSAGYRGRR